MKDSGIPWIGEIPDGWRIERIKTIFTERTELSENGNEELLSVSEYYGVDKRASRVDENETLFRSDSLVGYKKCYKGDFVSNIMLAWKGSFGITEYDGVVSPAYCVYKPSDSIFPKYYHYLFRTSMYTGQFRCYSKGIIDSRLRLYSPYFYDVSAIIPPLEEQQRIADFLDQKCGEVDEMVSLQEKIIEELKAYKQAIITEAVCKGLNPDAEMKDSGVEWIGKIPREWKMPKLGLITSKIGSGSTPRGGSETYSSSGIKFIRSQNVYNEGFRLDDVVYITEEIHNEMSGTHVCKGDILFNITGGSIGRCHFVEEGFGEANVNQHVSIVRPLPIVDTVFLMYALQSDYGQFQVQLQQTGGNREGLSANGFKEFVIALPPLSEQQQIAEFLDQKCADIDSLVAIKQQKIEELKEYKKSIIYEYITGKKEVAK